MSTLCVNDFCDICSLSQLHNNFSYLSLQRAYHVRLLALSDALKNSLFFKSHEVWLSACVSLTILTSNKYQEISVNWVMRCIFSNHTFILLSFPYNVSPSTDSRLTWSGDWQLASLCARPQQHGQCMDDRLWEDNPRVWHKATPSWRPMDWGEWRGRLPHRPHLPNYCPEPGGWHGRWADARRQHRREEWYLKVVVKILQPSTSGSGENLNWMLKFCPFIYFKRQQRNISHEESHCMSYGTWTSEMPTEIRSEIITALQNAFIYSYPWCLLNINKPQSCPIKKQVIMQNTCNAAGKKMNIWHVCCTCTHVCTYE